MLVENNDKFRALKQSYDERVKDETELKQMLRSAVDKNQQFEQLIH